MILFIVNIMGTTAQSKILWTLVYHFSNLTVLLLDLFVNCSEVPVCSKWICRWVANCKINCNVNVHFAPRFNQPQPPSQWRFQWKSNQHEARKAKQLFLATLVPVRGLPIVEKRSWIQSRYDEKWLLLCPNYAIYILPIEVHTHNGLPDISTFKYSNVTHICEEKEQMSAKYYLPFV